MKALRWSLIALMGLGMALPLQAGELGMKAPKLQVSKWVKGDAVDVTDGKSVYVVEFWATWCPPCRASIPHLTAMQKKYDGKVVFIGVSDEKVPTVEKFVKKMGDKMDYHVVVDAKDNPTGKSYMGEFGIRGIPHAFIIDKTGKIVWHDHPMADIDKVIDQVLTGDFDEKKAAKILAEREKAQKEMLATYQMVQNYFELVSSTGKETEAAELGQKILARGGDQPAIMNEFSWRILTDKNVQKRDVKLALAAAERANKATGGEDASILDTYAFALYKNGNKDAALKTQRKAVKIAEKDGADDLLKDLKKRLEKYENGG